MDADYRHALIWPAHANNFYRPENRPNRQPNQPRGWVLHTPEEPVDGYPGTPNWFANPSANASTHYYVHGNGDVYQMVPESCAAIANGVLGKPYPKWADPNHSLNWQSLNVEIEGYAHNIHQTLEVGGPQWKGLVRLLSDRALAYGIPLDREHIIGHYQVASNRTDPGPLFPWDALIRDLQEEEEMANPVWATWKDRPANVPFRSYLLYVGRDGLTSRMVPDSVEHNALAESGAAGDLLGVSLETLRAFGATPDPAS